MDLSPFSQGLVAVAAGDVEDAEKHSRRAENLLADPAMTRLLSAQTAQLSGDAQAATRFFTDMLERSETEFLGLRGLLMQAMKRDDRAEALQLAKRAFMLKPNSEWVAAILLDLQVHAGQWTDAEKTLETAIKNHAMDRGDISQKRAVVNFQLSLLASEHGDESAALSRAEKAHDLAPDFIPAALRFARLLVAMGRPRKAMPVIEKTWGRTPHPALSEVYWAATEAGDAMAQVRAAQHLASLNPDHPESRISLAKTALEARLWGVAREQLETAAKHNISGRVCRLMVELEEAEHGDTSRAREWLLRAASAEPDPAWVCETCGNALHDWQARCGKCGSFDSFVWRTPPRVLSLPAEDRTSARIGEAPRSLPAADLEPSDQGR